MISPAPDFSPRPRRCWAGWRTPDGFAGPELGRARWCNIRWAGCGKNGRRPGGAGAFPARGQTAAGLLFSLAAGGNCRAGGRDARPSARREGAILSRQSAIRPPPPCGSHPAVGTSARSIPFFRSCGATSASDISTFSDRPARRAPAYDRAFRANPADARLLYERDQLWKRLGEKPARACTNWNGIPTGGPAR